MSAMPAGHSHGASKSNWPTLVAEQRMTCLETARFDNGLYRCDADSETVSKFPFDAEPTAEQRQAAEEFAARNEAYVRKNFTDIEDAKAAGFVLDEFQMRLERVKGTPKEAAMRKQIEDGVVIHLQNEALSNDGVAADPEKPDVLMYATNGKKYVLVGSMFLAPIGTDGPQIGGPLTLWHNHDRVDDFGMVCFVGTAMVGLVKAAPDGSMGKSAAEGGCERGGPATGTSQMLHVHFGRKDLAETYAGNMTTPDLAKVLGTS